MGMDRSQQAYAQSVGTTPTNYTHIDSRDPTVNDITYYIGKFWLNQSNQSLWYLNSQNTTLGFLQSTWVPIQSSLQTLSDTVNTVVFPSLATDVPPHNIQLIGGTGVTITSNPITHSLTFTSSAVVMESITVDAFTAPGTNPVVPVANNITITGGQVAAGTTANVIRTDSLAAGSFTIEVQRSQMAAMSTIADNGVCHFNSADFSVDANGFVSTAGNIATLYTENSGTATPAAGNLNVLGVNNITTTGSGSTIDISVTGTTNHSVQVGNATGSLTSIGVGATNSVLQGSTGADPSFTTTPQVDSIKFTNFTGTQLSLNDYESGSWTPAVSFGGGTTGITYTAQGGFYIKIGLLVYFFCHVTLSNKGSSTGIARLTGFPFIIQTPATDYSISMATANISLPGGNTNAFINPGAGTTTASLSSYQAGAVTAFLDVTDANFTNTSNFLLSGAYLASA